MADNNFSSYAGIASTAMAAVGSALAQKAASDYNDIQLIWAAHDAESRARTIELQAKADALKLHSMYNKTQASNAVMAAAQGRRGGSVSQIADSASRQFKWDLAFRQLSAESAAQNEYANAGRTYDARETNSALSNANFAMNMVNTVTSLYSIGGSTKDRSNQLKTKTDVKED